MKNITSTIKFTLIIPALATSFLLGGCATISHGSSEKFTVASQPHFAKLTVDNRVVGKTPTQIRLSRDHEHTIKVNLAGYQPAQIYLKKTVSGWFFGNILLGGIIGIAVDAMDGAMYNLTPEQLNSYTSSSGMQYTKKTHTITVLLIKKASKGWHKVGQLKKV